MLASASRKRSSQERHATRRQSTFHRFQDRPPLGPAVYASCLPRLADQKKCPAGCRGTAPASYDPRPQGIRSPCPTPAGGYPLSAFMRQLSATSGVLVRKSSGEGVLGPCFFSKKHAHRGPHHCACVAVPATCPPCLPRSHHTQERVSTTGGCEKRGPRSSTARRFDGRRAMYNSELRHAPRPRPHTAGTPARPPGPAQTSTTVCAILQMTPRRTQGCNHLRSLETRDSPYLLPGNRRAGLETPWNPINGPNFF
jgi:hypothetical protein